MRLPTLADVERLLIETRMEELKGDKQAVARSLGISPSTLYKRLNGIYKLEPEPDYRRQLTRAELALVLDAFAREYQEKS